MKNLIYDLKAKFIKWFGDIKVYPYPMFILFKSDSYKINGNDARQILNKLEPGDILLRRFDHYLSGLMIYGYWTHAALYVGNNSVIHMLGNGICEEDILTFVRCDNIAIIRCNEIERIQVAIRRAKKQLEKGIKYDYDFDTDKPDKFYCTELINFCYKNPPIHRIKEKLILPDDILSLTWFDSYGFKLVWKK